MKIHTSEELETSASAVWNVLGEQFGDIANWFDGVVKSSMDSAVGVGAVRTCDVKAVGPVPEGKVVEKLTQFDRESRSLTFVITEGVPGFMKLVQNAWTVEDLENGRSRATSVVTVKLSWWALPMAPLIKMQLGKTLRSFVRALETASSTDTVDPHLVPAS